MEIAIMKTCANACCAAMAGAASSADPVETLKSIINSFAAIQEKTWQKISLPYARAATRPYIASFLPNRNSLARVRMALAIGGPSAALLAVARDSCAVAPSMRSFVVPERRRMRSVRPGCIIEPSSGALETQA